MMLIAFTLFIALLALFQAGSISGRMRKIEEALTQVDIEGFNLTVKKLREIIEKEHA